jgi:phosphate-selective porin
MLFVVLTMVASAATLAYADSSTKLMELLIKKGVITQEEAEVLKEEVRREEAREAQAPSYAKPGGQVLPAEKADMKQPDSFKWTDKIEVGYKNGAYIKTTDDRYLIKFNVGVEPMFSYEFLDDADDDATFRIRRARLYAAGNVFYPWLEYATQLTLEGDDGSALRDAYLEATYYDWIKPRAGQYKVPFDREFLVSGFSLEFVERSIASSEFSLQRDIGFQLSGGLLDDDLAYAIGVFNGSGANQNNVNTEFMYVGRLVWTPFGKVSYSQGAVDHPEDPGLALGIAAAYMPGLDPGEREELAGRLGSRQVVPVESDVTQLVADAAFQYQNLYLEGGYFFRNIDPNDPTPHGSENASGLYLQAGYFLVPEHFEVLGRYAYVDPDNPVATEDNEIHEGTLGVNYYIYGHRLKLQANYTLLSSEEEAEDLQDHIFRSSMVLLF